MNYLKIENAYATIYKFDPKTKKYFAVDSEDPKVAFYRFRKMSRNEFSEIQEEKIHGIREKYPEEFI